jgi:hypothetical protein
MEGRGTSTGTSHRWTWTVREDGREEPVTRDLALSESISLSTLILSRFHSDIHRSRSSLGAQSVLSGKNAIRRLAVPDGTAPAAGSTELRLRPGCQALQLPDGARRPLIPHLPNDTSRLERFAIPWIRW